MFLPRLSTMSNVGLASSVTVLICYSTLLVTSLHIKSGPFRLEVRQAEDCDNPEQYPIRIFGNQVRKINRTSFVYSMNFVNTIKIDDELHVYSRYAVFGNGGWKKNFFDTDLGGVCSALSTYATKLWSDFLGQLKQSCPIPPGNYSVKDLSLRVDTMWPAMEYNTYKLSLEFNKKGRCVFCKVFLVDVVPKNKRN